jgi:hypothetical protein
LFCIPLKTDCKLFVKLTAAVALLLLLLLLFVCVIDRLDPLITSIVKELFPYIQGREGGREGSEEGATKHEEV